MKRADIRRRCIELADECDRLAGHAKRVSFPMGQAVYNAAANLYDAAQMVHGAPDAMEDSRRQFEHHTLDCGLPD